MKKIVYVCAFVASTALNVAHAQDADPAVLATAEGVAAARAAALVAGTELIRGKVFADTIGQAHVRYQQTYLGLPVFGAQAIVHVDLASQTVLRTTDGLASFDAIDTRPTVDADDATARARNHFALPSGLTAKRDLVVLVDNGAASLAWQIHLTGDDASGRIDRMVFIDAQEGGVLRAWDNLHTSPAAGKGQGLYVGTVDLTTDKKFPAANTFFLRDPTRGNQYTTDLKNRTIGKGTVFTDNPDNVWGNGTETSRQTVGVDAQYGAAETWDYYLNVHGRNGIRDNGVGAYSRVHYGNNYDNAFWDDACFCMTYGDGGSFFNPLVSLDVAGHEMTHGVTSNTAGLIYSGESGGLNEATSDIFGTMVEFYANNANDVPDYLIGEEIVISGPPLRNMIQPSTDNVSSDCWYNGVGNLDVHYSSGVANHFYFLLAEGTTNGAPSKTCAAGNTRVATGNGTLTGIGRAKAEKIWYQALVAYMTPNTNYAAARTATLNAASDLYGFGGAEYNAVAAAWTAVNRP